MGLVASVASACSSSEDAQRVHVRSVAFEVPAGWERTETIEPSSTTIVWAPADNPRKESIAIIYSNANAAVAQSGSLTLQRLVAAAQSGLPQVRASSTTSFTTVRGLSGVSVQLEFMPLGTNTTYHRRHAVLTDGGALVHVLYTAKAPDASRFNAVLHTIHHEES